VTGLVPATDVQERAASPWAKRVSLTLTSNGYFTRRLAGIRQGQRLSRRPQNRVNLRAFAARAESCIFTESLLLFPEA
jgi:mannitol-1-phosphate/altronate dehydrogenase